MKIDFHVLEKSNQQQAWLYLCQLVENQYMAGERVYIHTQSKQDAERLDQLLWTFKDDSFIAHQLSPSEAPVQIGYDPSHAAKAHWLINLSNDIPNFLDGYSNAIEIVFADPSVQQLARERFKKYRELGHEISTYKL